MTNWFITCRKGWKKIRSMCANWLLWRYGILFFKMHYCVIYKCLCIYFFIIMSFRASNSHHQFSEQWKDVETQVSSHAYKWYIQINAKAVHTYYWLFHLYPDTCCLIQSVVFFSDRKRQFCCSGDVFRKGFSNTVRQWGGKGLLLLRLRLIVP